MIKSITASGAFTHIQGGTALQPYMGYNPGGQGVGNIRYNTSSNQLEIWDGSIWVKFPDTYASVGLTPDAEDAIRWSKQKMAEERVLKEKLEKYPALKDAYEKFKTIEALVYGEEDSGT